MVSTKILPYLKTEEKTSQLIEMIKFIRFIAFIKFINVKLEKPLNSCFAWKLIEQNYTCTYRYKIIALSFGLLGQKPLSMSSEKVRQFQI